VHLEQPQDLHDVTRLGVHAVDTTEPHHEEHLVLGLDIEGTVLTGRTLEVNQRLLLVTVLLNVCLGALERLGFAGQGLGGSRLR